MLFQHLKELLFRLEHTRRKDKGGVYNQSFCFKIIKNLFKNKIFIKINLIYVKAIILI